MNAGRTRDGPYMGPSETVTAYAVAGGFAQEAWTRYLDGSFANRVRQPLQQKW